MQACGIDSKNAPSAPPDPLTSYELTVYHLICELEHMHREESGGLSELNHAYYGRSLVLLLEMRHLSMTVLLCFLARLGQNDSNHRLVARFLQKVCAYLDYGAIHVFNEGHWNSSGNNMAFAGRHSIVGIFVRRVERKYASLDFSSQLELYKRWRDYVREPPQKEELEMAAAEWGWDFEELMLFQNLDLSIIMPRTQQ